MEVVKGSSGAGARVCHGQWLVREGLLLDCVIQEAASPPQPALEQVWVDWQQVLPLLVTAHKPSFRLVWTLQSVSYCPILDLLQEAALASTSSLLFRDLVASLVKEHPVLGYRGQAGWREYGGEHSQVWRAGGGAVQEGGEEEHGGGIIEEGNGDTQCSDASEVTVGGKVESDNTCGATRPPVMKRSSVLPLLPCQLCGLECRGEVRLYSHMVTRHQDQPALHPPRPRRTLFPCAVCGELYSRRALLTSHHLKHHPDLPPPSRDPVGQGKGKTGQHQCGGCDRSFAGLIWLYKHCVSDHPDQPDIRPEKPARVKGLRLAHMHEREELRCGLPGCTFSFSHFKSLVRHERTHTEASICILCGKPTWSCAALIEHCQSEHKGKSQFVCQTCGFYNYSEVMLKLHTVQVHMKGTKEYECTECDYKSSNQSTFAAHVRNHSTQSFVCEECGKECSSQQALSTHKRCHVSSSAHPYSCPYCPKKFPHVSLLKIHERVHTG